MSTAKMVADSTVSSTLLGDRRKRRKSGTNKHNKRTRKHSKNDERGHHSENSDSDLDLEKDLKTIGEYIKDRTEMLDNMFSAVRGPSLKRALPDILLDLPLDELKQRCLEQLEIMSKKRIRRILEGANPADISSSGTEDSSDKAETVELESLGTGEEMEEDIEYIEVEEEVEVTDYDEEGSVTKDAQSGEETEDEIAQEGKGESESEGQSDVENVSNDEAPAKTVEEEEMSDSGTVEEKTEDLNNQGQPNVAIAPILTKDQMEILELEMRARAIKAMLNKQPKSHSIITPGETTLSQAQHKPVELDNKTSMSDAAKDKTDVSDVSKGKSVPLLTGTERKPQHNKEQNVRTEVAATDLKQSFKQKQSKNLKAAMEVRKKGKILESVSPSKEAELFAPKKSSAAVQGNSVPPKVDAVTPDSPTINQSSMKDSNIAEDSTDQKSISTNRPGQKCHTSDGNEIWDCDISSRPNGAKNCQESTEAQSPLTKESQYVEPTKETLSGTNSKEVESCRESKESTTEEIRISEDKSKFDTEVLKEGKSVGGSQDACVELSGGLQEDKPITSENTPVDSSDTEEGEVTSGDDN